MNALKQKLRSLRFLTMLLLVAVAILLVILFTTRRQTKPLPEESLETVSVRTVERLVEVDGNLSGKDERELLLPTNAKIVSIAVSEGTTVAEGQELLVYQTSSLTGSAINNTLSSPIAGTITRLNAKPGEIWFSSGVAAVTVTDTSSFVIEVDINETDITEVKKDQSVSLVFPAISFTETFPAKVVSVATAPVEGSTAVNYSVVIVPEELPDNIRLGMSAEAAILTARVENVLAVPESFLIEKDDSYFVKTLSYTNEEETEYSISEEEIEIGLRTNTFVEVKSGLKEGTQIVEPSFTVSRSFSFFQ